MGAHYGIPSPLPSLWNMDQEGHVWLEHFFFFFLHDRAHVRERHWPLFSINSPWSFASRTISTSRIFLSFTSPTLKHTLGCHLQMGEHVSHINLRRERRKCQISHYYSRCWWGNANSKLTVKLCSERHLSFIEDMLVPVFFIKNTMNLRVHLF